MINLNGTFTLICSTCGMKHVFHPNDSDFDLVSSDGDNPMGVRNGYSWEHSFECGCKAEIEFSYDVYEYPLNSFEDDAVTISGGQVINKYDIDFQEELESDEIE
jgi:hypothetical protein